MQLRQLREIIFLLYDAVKKALISSVQFYKQLDLKNPFTIFVKIDYTLA